jgi:hypothetical protein
MINKTHVQNTLKELPDDFTLDQLVDRLIFLDKVEKGLVQSDSGEPISEADLDEEMARWFK